MDFDSPDVMKDFPGLYASELKKHCNNDSDYSDETDKVMKKDILSGKRKEKKDKEKGYAALEGESSADENVKSRSPSKSKKAKSFKFSTKTKEKRDKSREKDKDVDKKKERDKKTDKKVDKEKVKSEKVKKAKQSCDEAADIGDMLPVFGVPLEVTVERGRCHDGVDIPLPIREAIDYIEAVGISFEGVYKVSGTKSKVLHLRKMYNQRETINLGDYDVPTVTSLLKTFLRDLPEPIFTNELLIRFEEAGAILNGNTREKHLKILSDNLPPHNKLLLAWLIVHLNNISLNEKCNKMNKQNLAAALNHTFHCSSRLLNGLLHHSQSLFPNVTITRYIPPLESGAKLPEAPDLMEVELKKQESLLSQIHKEMNAGCITRQREELLWEVQRIITQLKRMLKNANKDKEVVTATASATALVTDKPIAVAESLEPICVPESSKTESQLTPAPLEFQEPVATTYEETEPFQETASSSNAGSEASAIIPCDSISRETTTSFVEELPASEAETEEIMRNVDETEGAPVGSSGDTASFIDRSIALAQHKNEELEHLRSVLLRSIQSEFNEIFVLTSELSEVEPNSPAVIPNLNSENLDEVMNLILKENQILQIKKINLVRQLIEEQEMCIELKALLYAKI